MSEGSRPPALVRARPCQDWLGHIAREDDPWRGRFQARLDPAVRAAIESANRIAWLPIAYHVHLAEVLEETFGAQRAHTFYRRIAGVWLENPVFGPFVRLALRILEPTPASIVRWAPKGWSLAFKDAGVLVGSEPAPGHARLEYRDLPPECTASDPWLASTHGSAYGILDAFGVDAVVRLDTKHKAEGWMAVDIAWTITRGR